MATVGMAPAINGRHFIAQYLTFFRNHFTEVEANGGIKVGEFPEGAVIHSITAFVKTAANGKKLKVGTKIDGKELAEIDVGSTGIKSQASINPCCMAENTPIYAKLDSALADGTPTEFILVINFSPRTDSRG